MHLDDRYETRCIQVADEVEAVLGRQVTRFRVMCAEHGALQANETPDPRSASLGYVLGPLGRKTLVSHIFRTTPATIGSQRGPVATAS